MELFHQTEIKTKRSNWVWSGCPAVPDNCWKFSSSTKTSSNSYDWNLAWSSYIDSANINWALSFIPVNFLMGLGCYNRSLKRMEESSKESKPGSGARRRRPGIRTQAYRDNETKARLRRKCKESDREHRQLLHFFLFLKSLFIFSSVHSLSRVWLFATPWIAARPAPLSITNSQSLLKLMPIKSVMPPSHLILCHPLLLLPPIPPSIRVFFSESTLHMRWPKYWNFSFSISPSNEHPGLISFKMDWLDLPAVQGTLKSLLQHHSSKALIFRCSAFFTVQLSYPYMTTGKTIALTRRTFCICFCCISTWVSHLHPLPLEPPSHLPSYPTRLGCHRALDSSFLGHTANFHWPSNSARGNVSSNATLNFPTLSFPPGIHKSVLCVCVSIVTLQTGSSF